MDELQPIAPIHFFQIRAVCRRLYGENFPRIKKTNKRSYLLPDTQRLSGETAFAEVYMGWLPQGLETLVEVHSPFQAASFPQVADGDAVELMIDTRDMKNSGYNTRFCHHFFFFPAAVNEIQAGEITRFRTEESHPLCDPQLLSTHVDFNDKGYQLALFIPKEALLGFDPDQFDRLGFTYRINRAGRSPQHFSACSDEFQIEQQPSLWSSLRLTQALDKA